MTPCERQVPARKGQHRGPLWPYHGCSRRAVAIVVTEFRPDDDTALCRQHADQARGICERVGAWYSERPATVEAAR